MGSIKTIMRLQDAMTPSLKTITQSVYGVIDATEKMQHSLGSTADVSDFNTAREELQNIENAVADVEDRIRQTQEQQEGFNDTIKQGRTSAKGLGAAFGKMAAAVGGYMAIIKTANLADELTSTKSRLNLINDGFQTTAELQKMIFDSAQRVRGSYTDTGQTVAKLGILAKSAFSSNEEMVAFAEQMNKQFKIGGASIQEQSAAMYQLTQAMAAGRLQGDEFRSVLENAPMLAQSIAEYMGLTIGELREMSSEGLITADIIKNAMFAATDETNAAFEQMPVKFGEVAQSIKNQAIRAFNPVLSKLSAITGTDKFTTFTNNMVDGLVRVATVAGFVFDALLTVANVVSNNWPIIKPIVIGIVGALIAYNTAVLVGNGIMATKAAIDGIAAAAMMLQSGATIGATVAQYGLNTALYACPVVWIIAGIIALIAIIFAVIGAINKLGGTSISVTGAVIGAFAVAGAYIYNSMISTLQVVIGVVEGIANRFVAFANFFANVFNDPVGSIIHLFGDLGDNVLNIVEKIAKGIDAVFGSNLAESVSGWRDGLQAMTEEAAKKYGNGKYEKKVSELDINAMLGNAGISLDRIAYGDAYNAGDQFGRGIENKIKDLFKGSNTTPMEEQLTALDNLNSSMSETANNTGSMADSMEVSEEELKYLRDLAEQEVINRFTTAEIKIEMNNENNISSEMDIDGVVTYLEDVLYESMETAAEGAA